MVAAQETIDLYRTHAKSLIAYASTLVGPSQAEDLVSETMMRILDRVDLSKVGNPRAYLFTSVLNRARSESRSRSARRRRELASTAGADICPAPTLADELGVLRCLSTRERAVIYLTYWEDMTVADVAACLDLSDGTVRRYLARARNKIRKELQS